MKYLIIPFLLSSQIVFGYYFPITHNSFVIIVTEHDKILINQKQSTLNNLGNQLYDYYSVNSVDQESDAFATYETFTLQDCQSQINSMITSERIIDVELYAMGHVHQLSHHVRNFHAVDKRSRKIVKHSRVLYRLFT